MTNAEKYKEVFGFPPALDNCPTECPFCPIRQQRIDCIQNTESCGNWWNSEYKESEEENLAYQKAVEDTAYCEQHEPTYNPDDGSM